jgi:hypothetical protein
VHRAVCPEALGNPLCFPCLAGEHLAPRILQAIVSPGAPENLRCAYSHTSFPLTIRGIRLFTPPPGPPTVFPLALRRTRLCTLSLQDIVVSSYSCRSGVHALNCGHVHAQHGTYFMFPLPRRRTPLGRTRHSRFPCPAGEPASHSFPLARRGTRLCTLYSITGLAGPAVSSAGQRNPPVHLSGERGSWIGVVPFPLSRRRTRRCTTQPSVLSPQLFPLPPTERFVPPLASAASFPLPLRRTCLRTWDRVVCCSATAKVSPAAQENSASHRRSGLSAIKSPRTSFSCRAGEHVCAQGASIGAVRRPRR